MSYLTTWPSTVYPVRAIEFTPNSSVSFVFAIWEQQMVIYSSAQDNAVQALVTPWLGTELKDLDYAPQVDVMILTHPNHEPRIIKYVGGAAPFTIGLLQDEATWKAPPFLKEDTSGTELLVSDEINFVKLVGDKSNTFTGITSTNLNTTPTYIELQVENKWTVYRLVDSNYSASVPDPTDTVCYAEPVNAVVDSFADSAKFLMVDSTYPELSTNITSNERELRSDTLVFNFDLEGAYARVPLDYGVDLADTRLRKAWSTGVESAGTDGYVWVQLTEYVGQDDFSTRVWEGTPNNSYAYKNFWEVGHVYKIDVPSSFLIEVGAVRQDRQATPEYIVEVDWDTAYSYQDEGDTFSLENVWRISSGGTSATRIADLSKLKTFDIMKTTAPLTMFSPPTDAKITFDDTSKVHTAVLTASASLFNTWDVGRYLMVKYSTTWTTYKITGYTSATKVAVSVIDSIPVSNEKGEYENNGRSSTWRFSAWKSQISTSETSGDWPYTVAFYEQRLVFGGNPSNPETIWFSKITDNYDFRTIEADGEVLDTTGITYPLGGISYNKTKWLSPGPTLMIGTESSEWQVKPSNFREGLTPTNIRISQETTEGSTLFALRSGSALIFPDRSGEFIKQSQYNYQTDNFQSTDLTLLADHLFRDDAVVDFARQRTPHEAFWFVTESGLVYVMEYNAAQDVLSWWRFQTRTGDKVLSVAVMESNTSLPNDRVYFMTQRNGRVYVEYMEDIYYEDASNLKPTMRFLDSAAHFTFTINTTQLTDLNRFNGETVRVVVDGADVGTVVVSGGIIDLTTIHPDLVATETAVVGYDYTSRYVSNPLSMNVDAGANYGKRTRIIKLGAYVYQSLGFQYGIYGDALETVEFREEGDLNDQSPPLYTGFFEDLIMENSFTLENQLAIEHSQPYPLTIMCLLPEM